MPIWVPKNAEFYTNPKSEGKEKKHSTEKLFTKNWPFASFFKINHYLCPFSQFRLQIWNENKILRLGTHFYLFKEKSFQLSFLKNHRWSILLNSMLMSRSGEGAGIAKFLLTCLVLHPICLKTFVVLFATIYPNPLFRQSRPSQKKSVKKYKIMGLLLVKKLFCCVSHNAVSIYQILEFKFIRIRKKLNPAKVPFGGSKETVW